MGLVFQYWLRLPVLVRSVVVGGIASIAGSAPWALLVSANTRYWSAFPWAAPVMAIYLWQYWRYVVRGWGWPGSTVEARRTNARANALSGDIWGLAIIAGVLGLVGILLLQGVLGRIVTLPQQRDVNVSQYPVSTAVAWVVMGAVVAGVVEETSLRGYVQGPIEQRHGPVVAILVTGVLFGLAHVTHPEIGVVFLPYYLSAAAVYGGLAYATNSTLPSMVLHAGGNMLSAFDLLARGRSEWQLESAPRPLIWQTGPDAAFCAALVALIVVTALAARAYVALREAARSVQGSER